MHKSVIVIAAIALVISASADAQRNSGSTVRYRWHDSQGLVHYSDSLSSEAMKYGYDVVNDQGLSIRHVDRQLTVQERIAVNKKAAEDAARKRAEDTVRRNEEQMLAAFPNEDDFVASQKDELNSIDQQIATTRANLRSQEKALTDLLDRAGELERAKQPVPKFLVDRIAEQRNIVGVQRDTLDRQLASYVKTELKNEQQLQRYRELKAQQHPDSDSQPNS